MFRVLLLFSLLLGCGLVAQGGMTSYTDRGKTDFDTALQILNAWGTWSKIDGAWAYTPTRPAVPYTEGRWIYTEYGWYWKGRLPHSWATEHYGYWKRGADKVWSWYPGPFWLPQTVEILATSTHIGWRSAAVDEDGSFVERPDDRYAKTDEWTFVTLAQFAGPITPDLAAKPEQVADLLEDSTESHHTYLTYREIDRPGPHPADFVALCKDGGMFAPRTLEDQLVAQPPPVSPIVIAPDLQKKISQMTGTNAPVLIDADQDSATDRRKVKYWITMSLPSFWAEPPAEAKPQEIYLYRPDFFQDNDGIARRIMLWFNPKARISLKEALANGSARRTPAAGQAAGSDTPVQPAGAAPSHDPFRSPFDDTYQPGDGVSHPAGVSSKNPGAGPIPSPLIHATNAPTGMAPR